MDDENIINNKSIYNTLMKSILYIIINKMSFYLF